LADVANRTAEQPMLRQSKDKLLALGARIAGDQFGEHRFKVFRADRKSLAVIGDDNRIVRRTEKYCRLQLVGMWWRGETTTSYSSI
jgi:hypothetical protein